MRLVNVLDEVFAKLESDPAFAVYVMDGQTIPIYDYLEIRPEKCPMVERFVKEGKFRLGPWYVLPDEWLVSGESLIRNILTGRALSGAMGAPASRAGFLCDMFGHTGQMPQILDQLGIPVAFVWRGTHENQVHGHFNWQAPDGTIIPTFRFSRNGYCTYASEVRCDRCRPEVFVDRLVAHVLEEAKRSPAGPILLFDGCDHTPIEPNTPEYIRLANERLASRGIRIVHSDLDHYMEDMLKGRSAITLTMKGELRESGSGPGDGHLIPGVLSSRIHLKQRNAACEDELCLWAEPFSAFAADLGNPYPEGFLRVSWKHLIENHPHDSMCGCSVDQVHQDMIYRFDQSLGISSRLTANALKTIALAAAPSSFPDSCRAVVVFNPTAEEINGPTDIDISFPAGWPKKFQEFFGYEEKFAFRLTGPDSREIPWQLAGHTKPDASQTIVHITAPLRVPAYGYTFLTVAPVEGPVRFPGRMTTAHDTIENEYLRVQVRSNGTLSVTDKRTGKRYEDFLTFEDCADIGDGWFHGIAVNDRAYLSSACPADVAVTADGIGKAILRIALNFPVPEAFGFTRMERYSRMTSLRIVSDVTLRAGSDHIEVVTTVENTARDHRLRVLFPTNLAGESFLSDAAFNVVERQIALPKDNAARFELDVETRPRITWTAFGDGRNGIAVVSRGLPECTVVDTPERPLALTLFRAFKRAAFYASPEGEGGQILGPHTFRYDIVAYAGTAPVKRLFLLGTRVNGPVRHVELTSADIKAAKKPGTLTASGSFLTVSGNAVVTSVQRVNGALLVRLFNPGSARERITLKPSVPVTSAKSVTLDGGEDIKTSVTVSGGGVELLVPGKRIATVRME
jgi:alpha-mannosidase/mannosylglycerate hydrolase